MALTHNIADIRKNYSRQELSEDAVTADPIHQFKIWLTEAIQSEVLEPTALTLSTVNAAGRPSARVVLLKDVSEEGFVFFTNYESRKGQELLQQPYAAMTFFWPELERQVRVEGIVKQVMAQVSDDYFHSRPKASQVGAWASPQSREIESRNVLEQAEQRYSEEFASMHEIPRPKHWGGFVLQPDRIEFWQGRPSRLHDRILYESDNQSWHLKRLAP